ncbi:hypothetical protein [Rhizobium azibense]|uniref:Lectin-like protein BA14k n=1 Tax=Rhizobium azibense TaxID=1136135 RepID=A0A4R3RCX6_9HYPH|nr:hypothetical protein [Rhizobium azibense]TCU33330.1 hypothetical protein EV129_11688 [Rhizobium azibense]
MSVLHKTMAAGLMALTLTGTCLMPATPANAGSSDEFWGGVAAGAVGGLLLSHAVRPYPGYGYYGPGPYYGADSGPYYGAYSRPYYRPYYSPYPVYRSYYRPYRPYYRSYYRPYPAYYRNYGYCGVERRYDHRADVWVRVRVCPGY